LGSGRGQSSHHINLTFRNQATYIVRL
jgi:ribonuclease HI